MPEPSSALHDFAIALTSGVEATPLLRTLHSLRERFPAAPPAVELFGRPSTGEVLVVLRFAAAHDSPALRQKMQTEAKKLEGRLVEPSLLSDEERQRFWTAELASYPVREDATADAPAAIAALRENMGLDGPPIVELRFGSPDELAAAYARGVAEGSLFVPCRRALATGMSVVLSLRAPGLEALDATGCILENGEEANERGFWALVSPGEALLAFAARRAAERRRGRRRMPEGGRRAHPRFDTCLDAQLEACAPLEKQWVTNVGRGGVFVRTQSPPPLHARVRLRVSLPGNETAETEAKVVHVVGVEEARARGVSPGVGLAFAMEDNKFLQKIDAFLARTPARRPRLLLAARDALLRVVLGDALRDAGCDVTTAADTKEALDRLTAGLFDLDAFVVDQSLPGLDPASLIQRIRRLGREIDLKVAALGGDPEVALVANLADDVIASGTPLEEIVVRIKRLLGR